MSTLSIKSRNTKSAAPKKGSAQSKTASRRKVTSPAANAKKPTRSVESKAERVAAAKTLSRLTSLIRLSYLAPDIVRALLEGRQPIELTPTRLFRLSKDLPHDWSEQ
jgi:hypothetical protein